MREKPTGSKHWNGTRFPLKASSLGIATTSYCRTKFGRRSSSERMISGLRSSSFIATGDLGLPRFSLSDQAGFQEFVPNIWWRLRGRPYLAVVVAERDFDSLVWVTGPDTPQHLTGIVVDGTTLKPTRLSSLGPECDEQYAF